MYFLIGLFWTKQMFYLQLRSSFCPILFHWCFLVLIVLDKKKKKRTYLVKMLKYLMQHAHSRLQGDFKLLKL